MGAMSVMGLKKRKQVFRPLIPDVDFITFKADLEKCWQTAGIILESIQVAQDLSTRE
jgi:acetylornithine/succinyldiaminopimelate/putrescine aminotransferase